VLCQGINKPKQSTIFNPIFRPASRLPGGLGAGTLGGLGVGQGR